MKNAPSHGLLLLALLSTIGLAACGGGGGGGDGLSAQATAASTTGCVTHSEQLTVVSGNSQVASPGAQLPDRLTARVTCESKTNRGTIAVARAAVEWRAGADGLVDGATTMTRQTDSDGLVSVAWTLADRFGTQTVTATVFTVAVAPVPRTIQFSARSVSTTSARSCLDLGGTDHGTQATIASDALWTAAGSPHRGGTIVLENARLEIEPGAVVCVSAIEASATSFGFVSAVGTPQAPIRFSGTAMRASSTLAHVIGENMLTVGPSVSISDSTFGWTAPRDPLACAQIVVGGSKSGAGGALLRTLIAGYGSSDCAALRVIDPQNSWDYGEANIEVRIVGAVGDAMSVLTTTTNPLRVTNCEMSSSGRHGMVVNAPPGAYLAVTGCNLFGNGGDAIANLSPVAINAPDNWWGDATGPHGPNGDGVSGAVTVTSARLAPVPLGY
jgi:hypothetical protein